MSGSINELLDQTLLFTASPKPRLVSASFPVSRAPSGGATAAGAATRRIWEYELQGLDSIRNVGVRQRTMSDMRMPVCQEVKWGDVKVAYQGKNLALPLTERFLLRTHYREAGAPMVAPNQDVTLRLLGPGSIRYTARIHAPVAGNWQIVMHHGAAYALSYSTKVDVAAWGNDRLTRDLQGDDDENGQWALFYWHLRYKLLQHPLREVDPTDTLADWLGSSDQYAERLSWDAAGFQAARNL